MLLGAVLIAYALIGHDWWIAGGAAASFFVPDAVGGLIFLALTIYAVITGQWWFAGGMIAYGLSPLVFGLIATHYGESLSK